MTQICTKTVSTRSSSRWLAGALTVSLLLPASAGAFFQQTKLEGAVGTPIGGVWLSMQQMMPEFRINYTKPTDGPAVPISVAPIPAELETVAGKNSPGVVISDCGTTRFCSEYGLLVGDILLKINSNELKDVASFTAALENIPQTVMLSIRRPALQMTTGRLFKIRHDVEGKEVNGTTVQEEEVDIRLLDVELPFAKAIEKTRVEHGVFKPTQEEIDNLAKDWFKLPVASPPMLIAGRHRFVNRENFDEALLADKSLKDAQFALVMDMDGNPIKGSGGQLIDVYGFESVSEKVISGEYVSVTIAKAPFPINIEFKGRFVMTRIADWSDEDDKLRAKELAERKPKEDLSKFETLPDVPEAAKKPADAAK